MKIEISRHASKARVFFAVALPITIICGFASLANAQSASAYASVVVRFTLPFEVHWGARIVPAGQYTMRVDNRHPASLVHSADGRIAFFTPIPVRDGGDKGPAALFVLVRGNERIVRSLYLPASNLTLIYAPSTSAEREILAKASHVTAVSVATAEK